VSFRCYDCGAELDKPGGHWCIPPAERMRRLIAEQDAKHQAIQKGETVFGSGPGRPLSPTLAWSQPDDPNDFRPKARRVWCPRWLQPLVFWILRRLG
jgi:hypothetical protein